MASARRQKKGRRVPQPPALSFGFDDVAEQIVGLSTWWLLTNPSRWVHRRVETVRFLDDVTVRRQISVDFSLPTEPWYLRAPDQVGQMYVPLTLLEKRKLTKFDLFDEERRSLPALTTCENGEVAGACLTAFAGQLVREAG